MDFTELLRQLKEEKRRLDRTIASLEAIWEIESQAASVPVKRKGRRTMPESERLEVSRRMKQYWATWRRQRSNQQQERDKVTSANA